ncbi:hypothetical protein ACIQNU_11905 [Streptomyces sp. NPDC091292]|uniref:hypothetical protein n=1 Tax=Streptomyces sp. NPDC091292 TaxID=3365991 RepID=UPI00382DA01C
MTEADEELVTAGRVAAVVATFEHALTLARGTRKVTDKEQPTVPRADMAAAHAFTKAVYAAVRDWRSRAETVRWPFFERVRMLGLIDAAASAARNAEIQMRLVLQSGPPGTDPVRSLYGGWPPVWLTWLAAAQLPFEIIVGERPLEGSAIDLAGDAEAHGVLLAIPVLGPLVLAFEAASGHSVTNWRRLTGLEVTLSVVMIFLPLIVGASVRGAARAAVITRRAVLVVLAQRGVFAAMRGPARTVLALRLAIGLRILSETEFQELLQLLRGTGTARVTPPAQLTRLTYLLTRIDYLSRAAQWLRHAEAAGLTTGYGKLPGATPSAVEELAGRRLAAVTDSPVVALPTELPEYYPGHQHVEGAKFPDLLWGRKKLCDIKEVNSTKLDDAFTFTAPKAQQANTVVVVFAKKSGLTPADWAARGADFWAKPETIGLDEVVLIGETEVRVLTRPEPYYVRAAYGVVRAAAPDPRRMAETARQVLTEPEDAPAEPAPPRP